MFWSRYRLVPPPSHCKNGQFSVLSSLLLQSRSSFLRILNIPGLTIYIVFRDHCKHPRPVFHGLECSRLSHTHFSPLSKGEYTYPQHPIAATLLTPSLPASPAQANSAFWVRHRLITFPLHLSSFSPRAVACVTILYYCFSHWPDSYWVSICTELFSVSCLL